MKTKPIPTNFFLRGIFLTTLFFLVANSILAQVRIAEEQWVLPTYAVNPPDKNPMFFKGESYQGASKVIYPYALNDMISNERVEQAWKALILENEYIKLCVTPEIGGKLYYGTDKTSNYNFIYKNNVVKPSNIGMTGAWVSGGIEWCVIHHHRASTFLPVDYDLQENADGSKTIWIGETEPRHRMRWTIGMTVFPGKSYFQTEVKIHNPTPFTNTMLYWANVAAHTNKDYQVIFPPSTNVATYHAKNSFTNWPFSTEVFNGEDFTKGVDISWWKNSVNQNSYFAYDLKEDFMGGYDHGRETGTVHIGDHNIVKGAKLWEWGSGAHGQATEGRLTETDGPYVEIMVGAFSDNQPDYSWIRPYEVKTFKQYWYPVKDIQGFKNANLNGAVNLEKRDDKVFLGYYSTQKINKAKIVLMKNGQPVFEKLVEISPEKAFTQIIPVGGNFKLTDLNTEMTNAETGELLVAYQPVEVQKPEKLPEEVKRPELPEKMATVEELYLTGSRILQFYNPTLNAMDYFSEALKRDPSDIRTNTAVGNIQLKNGEYHIARNYFATAIKRLTKDYTRPSNCEALYLQGITLKALGLYEEAIDTLYRATWDYAWHSAAYLELARISCFRGDYRKALVEIENSLETNSRNNSVIALKAAILRKLGNADEARELLEPLSFSDPLDFRTGYELYLLANIDGETEESAGLLSEFQVKMRGFVQNYREVAAGYLNDGFPDEAEEILKRYPYKNPMVSYWLGYLQNKKGDNINAKLNFAKASAMPTDYVFPFRAEDEKVLEKVIEYHPEDAVPIYYLGNLLYDKQPQRAIGYWEKAVKLDPLLAIAWRNLGWGYNHHLNDIQKSIAAYEKAFSLKKDEPVYYAELDVLYEQNNTPLATRAKLFDSAYNVVKQRDDAFVRQIMVLNLTGQVEKSVEYLENSNFHFREGSSRISDMTVDARLLLGNQLMIEGKFQQALEQFLAAMKREAEDEQAGARDPQINYFIGMANEALGNNELAKLSFKKSADQTLNRVGIISYYQGLSLKKLGEKTKAKKVFESLVTDGKQRMNQNSEPDFFAKFGERVSDNARLSDAHLMIGLGYKGLDDNAEAIKNLQKSVDLSVSNLWAAYELKNK
jgi:tetratricopeptide (TPR) repeat protein